MAEMGAFAEQVDAFVVDSTEATLLDMLRDLVATCDITVTTRLGEPGQTWTFTPRYARPLRVDD